VPDDTTAPYRTRPDKAKSAEAIAGNVRAGSGWHSSLGCTGEGTGKK
jgi:hypothetical protein